MLGPAARRDPSLRPQLPSTLRMSARAALGVAAGQYFSLFVLIGSAARRGIAEGLGAEALLAHGARRGGECSDRVGLLVPLHLGGPWALYGYELRGHAGFQGPRLRRSPGAGLHELPQFPPPRGRPPLRRPASAGSSRSRSGWAPAS